MGRTKRPALAAVCVLILTGCVSAKDAGRAWQGRHIDTAIAPLGDPTESRVSPSGSGSYLWKREWEEHFEEYTKIEGEFEGDRFVGTSRVVPARTEHHHRTFWLTTDNDGLIINGGGSSSEGDWLMPDSFRRFLPRD